MINISITWLRGWLSWLRWLLVRGAFHAKRKSQKLVFVNPLIRKHLSAVDHACKDDHLLAYHRRTHTPQVRTNDVKVFLLVDFCASTIAARKGKQR